jgi:hypothetical protein
MLVFYLPVNDCLIVGDGLAADGSHVVEDEQAVALEVGPERLIGDSKLSVLLVGPSRSFLGEDDVDLLLIGVGVLVDGVGLKPLLCDEVHPYLSH